MEYLKENRKEKLLPFIRKHSCIYMQGWQNMKTRYDIRSLHEDLNWVHPEYDEILGRLFQYSRNRIWPCARRKRRTACWWAYFRSSRTVLRLNRMKCDIYHSCSDVGISICNEAEWESQPITMVTASTQYRKGRVHCRWDGGGSENKARILYYIPCLSGTCTIHAKVNMVSVGFWRWC
jgi:hypothetical protein